MGYTLAKMATCAFLGSKASLAFVVGQKDSTRYCQLFVGIVTGFFCFGFLVVMISALSLAVFQVNNGNCAIIVPLAVNDALTAVDVISSVILLLLFIVPLHVTVTMNSNELTKNSKSSLKSTLLQNSVMGVLTTVSAGAALGTVTAFTTSTNGEGLLVGALTIVDITINCLIQAFSTRKIWVIRWDQRVRISSDNKKRNLMQNHGEDSSCPRPTKEEEEEEEESGGPVGINLAQTQLSGDIEIPKTLKDQ
eukprot:TRINITY_DN4365_c0_g1_i3.p1 TRINITY_DN4365_c0_g1~~TRINITY_DN4365_c0_g1_i3.p1  ORF type:complete len:250 (-),score=58.52 TRINITY_DN4365_c0_g1_i3:24-773(-)